MQHWKIGVALLAATMALAGCVDRESQKQAKRTEALSSDPSIPITVAQAETRTLTETVEISGAIATIEDATVGAKVDGRLVAVYVKDGDPVSAGQAIGQQDTTDANMRLRQAQAGVDAARSQLQQAMNAQRIGPQRSLAGVRAAEAQVRQAESRLALVRNGARPEERRQAEAAVNAARSSMETAKSNLDRMETLFKEGAVSQAQLDQARSAYQAALSQYQSALESQRILQTGSRQEDIEAAESAVRAAREALNDAKAQQRLDVQFGEQVSAARANVRSAEEQVALARQMVSDLTIRAPFAGRVSGRPTTPGTMLGGGAPVARIVSSEGVYFEGELPEAQLAKVGVGSSVVVKIDALPDRQWSGTVAAVNPLGDSVGRLFRVRISLDGSLEGVRPGMFARGTAEVGRIEGATVVPSSSIVTSTGKSAVFTIDGNKAKRVDVKTGLVRDGWTQVEGVPSGAQIAVYGANRLVDGASVKVEKQAPAGEKGA